MRRFRVIRPGFIARSHKSQGRSSLGDKPSERVERFREETWKRLLEKARKS
jgi:hypothetical protein